MRRHGERIQASMGKTRHHCACDMRGRITELYGRMRVSCCDYDLSWIVKPFSRQEVCCASK